MTPVLENIPRGALGMFFLIFVCFLLSTNRRAINCKLVGIGIFAQVMFAMGVLHTTILGQPVFWLAFGVILLYTIVKKYKELQRNEKPLTYSGGSISMVMVWQLFFVVGLLLA